MFECMSVYVHVNVHECCMYECMCLSVCVHARAESGAGKIHRAWTNLRNRPLSRVSMCVTVILCESVPTTVGLLG